MDTTRVEKILDALEGLYPEAKAELHFSNPFETLIATILSAQCTDKRVNQVTEKLFPLYPDAKAMARLTPEELEPMIRECGLYHSKAKNIVAACRALVEQYDGQVPADRKVLMAAFGDDQIPVDTHVFRVTRRIGLADADTPEKVEMQLRQVLPRERWSHAHHLLIWHGRRICHARGPECSRCPLKEHLCNETCAAN